MRPPRAEEPGRDHQGRINEEQIGAAGVSPGQVDRQVRQAAEDQDHPTRHPKPGADPRNGHRRQNVALVESTRQELNQQYAAELALNDQPMFGSGQATLATPTPMTQAVDGDFLSALDNGIANL